MADKTDPVKTVVQEGRAFLERNFPGSTADPFFGQPTKVPVAGVWGAWAFGLMKALYECPNCPGSYRIPVGDRVIRPYVVNCNSPEDILHCQNCGGNWVHQDAHPDIKALFNDS